MEASVQEAVTVAFGEMLVAAAGQVTVRPVAGLITSESAMVPEKSNVLVRVTAMAEPVAPLLKLTGVDALMEKSPTRTVIVVEFVGAFVPVPVPVMVTMYLPGVEEVNVQDAVAVPPTDTVAVVQLVTVTPEGVESPVNVISPANWPMPVTEIMVEPEAPRLKLEPVAVIENPLAGATVIVKVPWVSELSAGVGSVSPVGRLTKPFIV